MLNVASHLGCWGDEGDCVDLRYVNGRESGQRYLLKTFDLLLLSLCGARHMLLLVGHHLGITTQLLADEVLDLMGAKPVNDLKDPDDLCGSVMQQIGLFRGGEQQEEEWPRYQNFLLGFGNISFWVDQDSHLCNTRDHLMSQYEFHTFRSVLRTLRPGIAQKHEAAG